MPGTFKQIRERVRSLGSTTKITKAVQLVSSAKFRTAKKSLIHITELFQDVSHFANFIHTKIENTEIFFNNYEKNVFQGSKNENILLIAISPDKGLCGSINLHLQKKISSFILQNKQENITIFAIGKNIFNYVVKKFPKINIISQQDYSKALNNIMKNEEFASIYILYTHFLSALHYEARLSLTLPIQNSQILMHNPEDIDPEIILEPDVKTVVWTVSNIIFKSILNFTVANAAASEHAARMIAMEGATKNGKKMINSLILKSNKLRQNKITSELTDIVSGAQAI